MPKITKWSVQKNGRGVKTWRNDNTGRRVTIESPNSTTNTTNKYVVWSWKGNFRNRKSIGSSKRKDEAMDKARKWMQNHPMN